MPSVDQIRGIVGEERGESAERRGWEEWEGEGWVCDCMTSVVLDLS